MSRQRAAQLLMATAATLTLGTRCAAAEPAANLRDPDVAALQFDGERAREHVATQTRFGPRFTGSAGSARTAIWLQNHFRGAGWQVALQSFAVAGTVATNVFAWAGSGPTLLLGAHYDTRLVADADPNPAHRDEPSPGANDGGSGTAVLVELARVVQRDRVGHTICLAFFDAEDNGRLPGWEDWSLGSRYFVAHREDVPACAAPRAVVVVDMVGDPVQRLHRDRNSSPELIAALWPLAQALGYGEYWPDTSPYRIVDDHLPFVEAGIPGVLVIDFEAPRWHTTSDTIEGVDAAALARAGRVIEAWLELGAPF